MLDDFQRTEVWDNLLAAEARSLYFADLASRYTRRKQWIIGVSFFLSSSTAATLIGKAPPWIPIVLSFIVAGATVYSIAVNLDGKIATMAKLHSSWGRIAQKYSKLFSHMADADAEAQLYAIIEMEREPSEVVTTDAPYNRKLLAEWQDRVFALYRQTDQVQAAPQPVAQVAQRASSDQHATV